MIGCFLSHRAAWQRCAESDQPLLVLEDDVCPAAGFAHKVRVRVRVRVALTLTLTLTLTRHPGVRGVGGQPPVAPRGSGPAAPAVGVVNG